MKSEMQILRFYLVGQRYGQIYSTFNFATVFWFHFGHTLLTLLMNTVTVLFRHYTPTASLPTFMVMFNTREIKIIYLTQYSKYTRRVSHADIHALQSKRQYVQIPNIGDTAMKTVKHHFFSMSG